MSMISVCSCALGDLAMGPRQAPGRILQSHVAMGKSFHSPTRHGVKPYPRFGNCQPSSSRDSSYCYSTIRTHHDHRLGRHIGAAVTAVVIAFAIAFVIAFVIASEGRAGRASYSSSI